LISFEFILKNMKFNPIKRILYTDGGEVIKKLECPFTVSDDSYSHTGSDEFCHICNQPVVDTSKASDAELMRLASQHPGLCLKVDPAQQNLQIVYARIN
jgi:hypothetical protein